MNDLSEASLGTKVMVGGKKLKVSRSTTGCNGCVFEKEEGARFCEFVSFCFAHNRSDKIPVKFIKVEE